MKLWLDDLRAAPVGWTHALSVNQATRIILRHYFVGEFEEASLDNDLGYYAQDGGDGYKLVAWMIENDIWPRKMPKVHSMNPVRNVQMRQDIERYWHGAA